jgi:hypothetical protein
MSQICGFAECQETNDVSMFKCVFLGGIFVKV